MRILLVDDDNALMESLAERLIQQRYAVDIAVDGDTAGTYVDLFNYDLIVLDLMLPDGDGIQFCRQFRQMGYGNPLMILTAKESTAQKVEALDAGADDYVVKPFDFDELCARIRALLRRENQGLPTVLVWGALKLDPSTCETTYRNQSIRLTPKEFSLMELFLRSPNRVYSLGAIIDDLWSFEAPPGEDAVRTHIKGLRQKLKSAGAPKDLIKTVYGLGYRLNDSAKTPDLQTEGSDKANSAASVSTNAEGKKVTAKNKNSKSKDSKNNESVRASSRQELAERKTSPERVDAQTAEMANMQEQLAQACRRYLRSASQQIAALEKAAIAFLKAANTTEPIDSQIYQESHTNAHKLAGSLGSYGLPEGSVAARKIEQTLQGISSPFVVSIQSATQIDSLVNQLRHHVDSATVQDVIESTSTSLRGNTPLILVISAENEFVRRIEQITRSSYLRVTAVSSAAQARDLFSAFLGEQVREQPKDQPENQPREQPREQAGEQLNRSSHSQKTSRSSRPIIALPDLVLIDVGNKISNREKEEADDYDDVLGLVKTVKQVGQMPVMVVGEQIELDCRLQMVKQGVEVVTDRSLGSQKLTTIISELITAKTSQIRIALADDEPQAIALVKNILAPWGFQIVTFASAAQLWNWLNDQEPSNTPASDAITSDAIRQQHAVDMIVLDIEMPDITGLELCQVIRADSRFQSVPVLFLSQHQENTLRIEAFQSGADDFIDKAIAPTELATRLCNQLTRACRLQQPHPLV